MKQLFRRLFLCFLCLSTLVALGVAVAAEDGEATNLRKQITVTGSGYSSFRFLTNNDLTDYTKSSGSCDITVESPEANISLLYLMFNLE